MKNIFSGLLALGMSGLLLSLGACKKDEDKVVIGSPSVPLLTASTATPAIVRATPNATAVTYTWTAVDYGYQAAVVYTLQFAKANTNFVRTTDFSLGTALSKSFTSLELNNLYNNIDCNLAVMPAAVPLEVRVVATVGDAAPKAMSTSKPVNASPYPSFTPPTDTWGLVGPAGDGWPGAPNPAVTDRTLSYDCTIQSYTFRTTLNAGPFKFRANRDWGTNLGGVTGDYTKGVDLTTGGPDMVIAAGTYTVKLEVKTNATGVTTGGRVTITP